MNQPESIRVIASDLRFPEGPIALPNGDVLCVEIERGTLTQISPDGHTEIVADLGGGPNGAAMGPDGKVYICNNGGFTWTEKSGLLIPGEAPDDYSGSSIQRVCLDSGKVETLYTECNGIPLKGPNDLVFDRHGGFWFTDNGKRRDRDMDITATYYAKADGSGISEQIFPMFEPNGIALSEDDSVLYVAETRVGRIWRYPLTSPGQVVELDGPFNPEYLLYGAAGFELYDSMALDTDGNLCVGALFTGGIRTISPEGKDLGLFATEDPLPTNICFGGEGLRKAYITLSGTGRLIEVNWPRPGLPLHFLNR